VDNRDQYYSQAVGRRAMLFETARPNNCDVIRVNLNWLG
jgi:hypothetical protein